MASFDARLISVLLCVAMELSACATLPHTNAQPRQDQAAKVFAVNQTDAGSPPIVAATRSDALEIINEGCPNNYEIVSEGSQASEAGIAWPVGAHTETRPHWYIGYRCKAGNP